MRIQGRSPICALGGRNLLPSCPASSRPLSRAPVAVTLCVTHWVGPLAMRTNRPESPPLAVWSDSLGLLSSGILSSWFPCPSPSPCLHYPRSYVARSFATPTAFQDVPGARLQIGYTSTLRRTGADGRPSPWQGDARVDENAKQDADFGLPVRIARTSTPVPSRLFPAVPLAVTLRVTHHLASLPGLYVDQDRGLWLGVSATTIRILTVWFAILRSPFPPGPRRCPLVRFPCIGASRRPNARHVHPAASRLIPSSLHPKIAPNKGTGVPNR